MDSTKIKDELKQYATSVCFCCSLPATEDCPNFENSFETVENIGRAYRKVTGLKSAKLVQDKIGRICRSCEGLLHKGDTYGIRTEGTISLSLLFPFSSRILQTMQQRSHSANRGRLRAMYLMSVAKRDPVPNQGQIYSTRSHPLRWYQKGVEIEKSSVDGQQNMRTLFRAVRVDLIFS
jgi:hypothetical protein